VKFVVAVSATFRVSGVFILEVGHDRFGYWNVPEHPTDSLTRKQVSRGDVR
jgi:hypothetical protein